MSVLSTICLVAAVIIFLIDARGVKKMTPQEIIKKELESLLGGRPLETVLAERKQDVKLAYSVLNSTQMSINTRPVTRAMMAVNWGYEWRSADTIVKQANARYDELRGLAYLNGHGSVVDKINKSK